MIEFIHGSGRVRAVRMVGAFIFNGRTYVGGNNYIVFWPGSSRSVMTRGAIEAAYTVIKDDE